MSDQAPDDLEQEWSAQHPTPSGLEPDDPRRLAAVDRARSWHDGDVPEHHAEPEPFPPASE